MKKIILIFGILFFLFQASNISAQNQPSNKSRLTEEELLAIYHQKIKEFDPPTEIKTENKVHFEEDLTIRYDYNRRFNKEIAVIGTGRTRFEMEIDPETGRIIGYFDDLISFSEGDDWCKGGSKPTKKKEEIIKEAKRIVKIINGKIPEDAYFTNAWYDVMGWHDAEYSCRGSWQIKWGRKEGDHRYKKDVISVSIDEKYGFYSYGYYFFSHYNPPKKINISKEKAIDIAKKHIDDIMHNPHWGGWYRGYSLGDIHSAELTIVNPNYITKPRKDFDSRPTPYARLAWLVKFNCIESKISEDLYLERIAPAQAWIDAETGELLGGR